MRHFHVVFTLPAELRPLVREHPIALLDLLFVAAAETIVALGRDPARLGALVGVTAVVHTWGRNLSYHPHLHCIVTGRRAGRRRCLGRLGRQVPAAGQGARAPLPGEIPRRPRQALRRRKARARTAQPQGRQRSPRAGGRSRGSRRGSTARTGWSTRRRPSGIRRRCSGTWAFTRTGWRSRTGACSPSTTSRSSSARGTARVCRLAPLEFMRRFLQHLLPHGFVKIRHFGLLAAGNVNGKLAAARAALEQRQERRGSQEEPSPQPAPSDAPRSTGRALFHQLTGIDLGVCPDCGAAVIAEPLVETASQARAPPEEPSQ